MTSRPYLRVEPANYTPEPAPDPDGQAADQVGRAVARIAVDTSGFPRFPWRSLDSTTGPMAPGELWIVAARTGMGKTLFMLNLFDDLVQKQGISVFYIGLEQTPAEMRTKWACLATGVPQAGILAGKWPVMWSEREISDAQRQVKAEIERQATRELRTMARFCEARFVDAARLKHWTAWAVEHGAQVIVVDHLNRIARDEHRTSFDAHSHIVTTAKELAIEHEIVVLAASQVGRPNGDPVQRFTPPALQELRGGGTSEEEANAVLMVYRPLSLTANDKQIQAVRRGQAEETTLYEPDRMAVRVAKHRLLGLQPMQTATLRVQHGRIIDLWGAPS